MIHTLTYEEAVAQCPAIAATGPSAKASQRYAFIPTSEILKQAIDKDWRIREVQKAPGNLGMHCVKLIHKSQTNTDLSAVEGFPQMHIINSHNLTKKFSMAMGFYRLVCSNGLIAPTGLVNSIGALHRQKSGEVNLFESITESLNSSLSQFHAMTDKVETMKSVSLSETEKNMLARYAHYIRFRYRMTQPKKFDPTQILKPRRDVDVGNSLWLTFNVIQENMTKGGSQIGRGITQFQDDLRFNQEFWTGVEKAIVHREEDLSVQLKKLFPKKERPRKS